MQTKPLGSEQRRVAESDGSRDLDSALQPSNQDAGAMSAERGTVTPKVQRKPSEDDVLGVALHSDISRSETVEASPPERSNNVVEDEPPLGIQAQLKVGAPNDSLEQEADLVADQVVQRMAVNSVSPDTGVRQSLRTKRSARRRPALQAKGGDGSSEAKNLDARVRASTGEGRPMEPSLEASMSESFGVDFSAVRIHTGSSSEHMNDELHSRAFTHGMNIHFNAGEYQPHNSSGQRLMAHELTHVVQQNGGLDRNRAKQGSRRGDLTQSKARGPIVSTATRPTIRRKFAGTDGKSVEMKKKAGQIVISSKNASADLMELIRLVNASGSKTAVDQIMKASNNESTINVRIETKPIANNLYGLHQAHDKSGKALDWNSEKGDFDGVPAYRGGDSGTRVYQEATITIFKGNLEKGGGNTSSHDSAGVKLTLEQLMAGTFVHELGHNTDEEFIEDLRKRREGEKNKGLDAHKNITPLEQKVYGEIGDHERKLRELIKPCMDDKDNILPGGVGLVTHINRTIELTTVLGNEKGFLEEQIRRNDDARRFVCEAGVPAMIALYDTRNSGVLLEVECARRALAMHGKHYRHAALTRRRHELLRPFFTSRKYWMALHSSDKGKAKLGNLEPLSPVRALTDAPVNGRQLVRVMAGPLHCKEGFITLHKSLVEPKASSLEDPTRLSLVFMENPRRFGSTFLEIGVGQATQNTRLREYVPSNEETGEGEKKKSGDKFRRIEKGRVFIILRSGHTAKEYRINIRLGSDRVDGFIDKNHVQDDREKRRKERNYFLRVGRRIAKGRKTIFVDPSTQKCSNDRLPIEFNSAQEIVRGIVGAARCAQGTVDEVHIVGHGGTHGMPGVGDFAQIFGLYINEKDKNLARQSEPGGMTVDQFSGATKTALADGVRFWIHACSTADTYQKADPTNEDEAKRKRIPGFAEQLAASLHAKGDHTQAEVAALPGIGRASKGIEHIYQFRVFPAAQPGAKPKKEFFPQKL